MMMTGDEEEGSEGGGGCAPCKREDDKEGVEVGRGAAFRKRRRTYLTLQPCQREQNTEESRG